MTVAKCYNGYDPNPIASMSGLDCGDCDLCSSCRYSRIGFDPRSLLEENPDKSLAILCRTCSQCRINCPKGFDPREKSSKIIEERRDRVDRIFLKLVSASGILNDYILVALSMDPRFLLRKIVPAIILAFRTGSPISRLDSAYRERIREEIEKWME